MTIFLRLLAEEDKGAGLSTACARLRQGEIDLRLFDVSPEAFDAVPGKPFAYWVSERVRDLFVSLPKSESGGRRFTKGLCTTDDDRFLRAHWEISNRLYGNSKCDCESGKTWVSFAKGGASHLFYCDIKLVINWADNGSELKAFLDWKIGKSGQWSRWINSVDFYFRPGLTWPLRAARFSPQVLSSGAIFSVRGYAAFAPIADLDWLLGLVSSKAFDYLFKILLGRFGFPEFVVGVLQQLPIPVLASQDMKTLGIHARRAWSLKRALDTITETSHAFLLPAALRPRLGDYDVPVIETELAQIQAQIDKLAFDLYGFDEADRAAALNPGKLTAEDEVDTEEEDDDDSSVSTVANILDLPSWAAGVAFGRFDCRLATGERAAPPEPDPFDPLPAKSPSMLPDGAAPFHAHPGILVDDPSHPHDLAHLIEEVLGRINAPVPDDVRRWLERDFFPFHLQRYSKSRRKAPIYWPLATGSGGYTLWLYYPSLDGETLYTAVNDFVEPKLKQVGSDLAALRKKGAARSRDDERRFDSLQTLELELIELRDTLLQLAPNYKPNHDDGVQITAAPLWPLFRHKPWQKVLKETWEKLSKGDYDWAHLAMNFWPERVREKCKTDKSLAIAHGLEDLYVEPPAKPKKARSGKKTGQR